jgi:hypothetical protein
MPARTEAAMPVWLDAAYCSAWLLPIPGKAAKNSIPQREEALLEPPAQSLRQSSAAAGGLVR